MYTDMYPANEGTPHNKALPGDIAKTVLMPGDPLRAKYVAENYLENVKEFSTVRNVKDVADAIETLTLMVNG